MADDINMKNSMWQRVLAGLLQIAEVPFDWLKYRLGSRLTGEESYLIIPYLGFGGREFVYLKGRVLADRGILPSKETDRFWHNLKNMYRRFESDEIPYAKVRANYHGIEQTAMADEEGYFTIRIDTEEDSRVNNGWQKVHLELLEPVNFQNRKVEADGQVLIVSSRASFGVISDIDDTVIYTGVTNRLKLGYTIFFKNARTRSPLRGVADFYRALESEREAGIINPLFYVSSSPWNMYDLFQEFFHLNNIPPGPIFLRDWGLNEDSIFAARNREFKKGAIQRILSAYPEMKFILIGDSGEQDAEIYLDIIRAYPGRILAAYIRSVKQDERRYTEIHALAAAAAAAGSAMILAEDTRDMVKHAGLQGWISSTPAF
jgi:phosphatidate phosphatase APP1